MKKANQNIVNTLVELRNNYIKEHAKLKTEFDNEKDKSKRDLLYKKGEAVVKNYKLVDSYLNKYQTLLTLFSKETDETKKSKISTQIENLEKEVIEKYNVKIKKTEKKQKEENKPLEKGKKYTVTNKKNVAKNSIGLTFNSLFGLGKSVLAISSGAAAVNYFTTLAFPVSLIGGIPMLALAGVFAYGTVKSIARSVNNYNEIKNSLKM